MLNRHQKIRVDQWKKKLLENTKNKEFKKNRNNYAKLMKEMVFNKNLGFPFNQSPNEGYLPILNPFLIPKSHKIEKIWNSRSDLDTIKQKLKGNLIKMAYKPIEDTEITDTSDEIRQKDKIIRFQSEKIQKLKRENEVLRKLASKHTLFSAQKSNTSRSSKETPCKHVSFTLSPDSDQKLEELLEMESSLRMRRRLDYSRTSDEMSIDDSG